MGRAEGAGYLLGLAKAQGAEEALWRGQGLVWPQCPSGIYAISGSSPSLRRLLRASWSGGDGNTGLRLPTALRSVRGYHVSDWVGAGKHHCIRVSVGRGRRGSTPALVSHLVGGHSHSGCLLKICGKPSNAHLFLLFTKAQLQSLS